MRKSRSVQWALLQFYYGRKIVMIKNLSQLKKKLRPGARFQIIEHWKKEFIGQIREVSHLHSNGFHSKVLADPQHWVSLANDGKGYMLWWKTAKHWEFHDGICTFYNNRDIHSPEYLVLSFRFFEQEVA